MSTVVLLGAGASYGSIDAEPHTPPLGAHLFDELIKAGGAATTIPDDLKELFRRDFESGMAEYYERSGRNVMQFQRELAHYLAKFTPGPKNAYIRLLRELGTKHVVYSSLNYDMLIEEATRFVGIKGFSYSTDAPPGFLMILKLHGSCNFWPNIPLGALRNVQIFDSAGADVVAPIRPLRREESLHRCKHDDSLAPAMAMYAKGKTVKISPEYVEQQQAQWNIALNKASNVFISGVRVVKEDRHIWDTLAKTKASITYFGRPNSRTEFEEWKQLCGKRNLYFVEADFEKCIDHMKMRLGKR